jgi:hypothetical protein
MAVLGVFVVLILDVFAASPALHEAICHHNHCIEVAEGGVNHGASSNHSHNGCYGCIITVFAAGHVTPFLFFFFAVQQVAFRFSWKTVSEQQVWCKREQIWPLQTGPPENNVM